MTKEAAIRKVWARTDYASQHPDNLKREVIIKELEPKCSAFIVVGSPHKARGFVIKDGDAQLVEMGTIDGQSLVVRVITSGDGVEVVSNRRKR